MAILTVREALQQALHEAMQDERVFIIGEDIGHYGSTYGVTAGFLEKYGPERIRDAPIAEAGILGLATGAAMAGMPARIRDAVPVPVLDGIAAGVGLLEMLVRMKPAKARTGSLAHPGQRPTQGLSPALAALLAAGA